MALFSYMSVLCLVPLILNKNDEFVDFHSRQGLVLWIWGIISVFSLKIPGIGGFFFSFSVAFILALSLVGIVSVLFYRAWKIPVISGLAKRL